MFEASTSVLDSDSTTRVKNTAMITTRELQSPRAHRHVLRVGMQDDMWTVSVAEDPHCPFSYTLYVKSKCPFTTCRAELTAPLPFLAPTRNLTLSRTALELVELDHKLHDAHPSVPRPALPIDPSALPRLTKRKSVILNTLSRLASPVSKSTGARNSISQFFATSPVSPIPSTLPTPIVSPTAEITGSFFDDDLGAVAVNASNSANSTTTGLAAYLTTLSNDQVFRQARPWKQFVRVRIDDLESTCVERATQRVCSDAATHITSPSTVNVTMHNSRVLHDAERTGVEHETQEAATREQDDRLTQNTESFPSLDHSEGNPSPVLEDTEPTCASARSVVEVDASYNGSVVRPISHSHPPLERFRTSVNGDQRDACLIQDSNRTLSHASPCYLRRPCSLSTSARVPPQSCVRLYDTSPTSASTNSVMFPDSGSIARPMLPSQSPIFPSFTARKVQVSDFEMIRVLGKGRAGKVLLVRHKSSSLLYALKAITKRHTLTEQAVLRRMAAEGTDPFIVKLWWSFHNDENLFLVMVGLAYIHIRCFVLTLYRDRTSTLAATLGHS